MRGTIALLFWLAQSRPATAHGSGVPVTPEDLWTHWSLDPFLWGGLILLHWLYGRGVLRLRLRAGPGRGVSAGRISCFLLFELVILIALASPLDELGETLQSAHMVQHGLLIFAAPPLLLAARPGAVLAHGMGPRLAGSRFMRGLSRAVRRVGSPGMAAGLHALALWGWHWPLFYEAALTSPALHWLEHLSFAGSAALIWRATRFGAPASAFGAALFTLLHGGLVGALLTLAPIPLYDWYVGRTDAWGLSALDDQQLAGTIMWAPMGAGYLVLALLAAHRLLALSEPSGPRPVHPLRAGDIR